MLARLLPYGSTNRNEKLTTRVGANVRKVLPNKRSKPMEDLAHARNLSTYSYST